MAVVLRKPHRLIHLLLIGRRGLDESLGHQTLVLAFFFSYSQSSSSKGSPCRAVFNHKGISLSINTASCFSFFPWVSSTAYQSCLCAQTQHGGGAASPESREECCPVIAWGPGLALSDGVAEKGLSSIDVTFLML